MSVYAKLIRARVALQGVALKKSGQNKFAGYSYFELADFLPSIQQIFADVGLCGVVSYSTDTATLTIVDVDKPEDKVVITSPMAEANLKGTHPIQNLGAVETYQRRYLWMTAMEIVEHDILDASPPQESKPEPKVEPKPEPKVPKKVEGDPGKFQIKVKAKDGADPQEWLALVDDAAQICLGVAQSSDDVLQIFRKNKQLFDEVKAMDATFFAALMAKFTETKKALT